MLFRSCDVDSRQTNQAACPRAHVPTASGGARRERICRRAAPARRRLSDPDLQPAWPGGFGTPPGALVGPSRGDRSTPSSGDSGPGSSPVRTSHWRTPVGCSPVRAGSRASRREAGIAYPDKSFPRGRGGGPARFPVAARDTVTASAPESHKAPGLVASNSPAGKGSKSLFLFGITCQSSSGPAGGTSDSYGLGRGAAGPDRRCTTTAAGALRAIV